MAKVGPDSPIPSWMRKWFVINAAFLLYDGAFCVLRPLSLGDGWIGKCYFAYRYYVETDKHYGDSSDSFIWAQGFGNLLESMLCFMVFFNCLGNIRKTKLLALVVSVMNSWKTVLFILYSTDYPQGGHAVPSWPKEICLVFLLSSFWVVFPAYVAYKLLLDFGWAGPSGGGNVKDEDASEDGGGHHYNLRNRRT